MKRLLIIVCLWLAVTPAVSWAVSQNLLVTSGRTDSERRFQRAVFYIEAPKSYTGPLHVRIFDADLGGMYDRQKDNGSAHYYIYGKSAIDRRISGYDDPLPEAPPIFSLSLGESRHHDNRWRTVKTLAMADGEPVDGYVCFQLIAEIDSPHSTNKYQIFISSHEKQNQAVEGVRLTSPVVSLQLPADKTKITQLRMQPPETAQTLDITNFDADKRNFGTRIYFETPYRSRHPLDASQNGKSRASRVELLPEEKGRECAIVISSHKVNYISLWAADGETGEPVMIELPPLLTSVNHLPRPQIQAVHLSDCTTVVLDATATLDPDGDDLFFTWQFEDGTVQQGKRILYDFQKTGVYKVKLEVQDASGLVASTSRTETDIKIVAPPKPVMKTPDKGVPGEELGFRAGVEEDGPAEKKIEYEWEMGDGARVRGEQITHAYARPGRYTVTLSAIRPDEKICDRQSVSQGVWINSPPVATFFPKPVVAAGESVLLDASESIDSDGEIARYVWSVDGEPIGEGEQISHQWDHPGTYTVELRITDDAGMGNSADVEKKEIRINAPPRPEITLPLIGAVGEKIRFSAERSTDPDDKITAYEWRFGDGAEAKTPEAVHAYSAPGTYQITLAVEDGSNVDNSRIETTATLRINHPPTANAGTDQRINDSLAFFDGSGSTDPDDEIISYEWDFGDGGTGVGKETRHVYRLPGDYRVTLTVTDGSGSLNARTSDTMQLSINHRPVADAGSDRTLAAGESASFDAALSSDPDGEIVKWLWQVDGQRYETKEADHLFEQPGVYQVLLTVEDNDGATAYDTSLITVNAAPLPAFEIPLRAAPGKAVFFDGARSVDPDGEIRQYTWHFGDESVPQTGVSVQHAFEKPGRYPITLGVEDDSTASNRSASVTRTLAVNYPPVARAGEDVRTCGQSVLFDGSASVDPDGDGLIYRWQFGDGQTAAGVTVVHHYEQPGRYPVMLTVDDGTGLENSAASASLTVSINAPPRPVIQANRLRSCTGEAVLFDAGSSSDPENSPLLYQWDLGDGKWVEEINPIKTYTQAGVYRIRLKVTDESDLPCNTAVTETVLHVIDGPLARAGEDIETCANATVAFDGSGSSGGNQEIKSYTWDFGDGAEGVGPKPVHVYDRPGDYTARLKIITAGQGTCGIASEDAVQVSVRPAPKAEFTAPDEICVGETFTCDAGASSSGLGPITLYEWHFGSGQTAQGEQATHSFDTPGVYEILLKIKAEGADQCNEAAARRKIRVNQPPAAAFAIVRAGERLPKEGGRVRAGDILQFDAIESHDPDGWITEYAWAFGDGDTATGVTAEHVFKDAGERMVRLTVTDDTRTGCRAGILEIPVLVESPKPLPIEGPDIVCQGESAVYTVQESNESTEWQISNGEGASGPQLDYRFEMPGRYQIQARVGDEWTQTHPVRVLPAKEIEVPERLSVYAGELFRITPVFASFYAKRLHFAWSSESGSLSETPVLDYQFDEPGTQKMTLTVTDTEGVACLSETRPVEITVLPVPEVDIRVAPEIVFSGGARDEVHFEAVTKETEKRWRYQWEMGDGQIRSGRRIHHVYTSPGHYRVTVRLTDPLGIAKRDYPFTTEIEVRPGDTRTQ